MRRIATSRIIGLLSASIGVVVSIMFAWEAGRLNTEFYQWVDARPMETAIDFSQPGETSTSFKQTCDSSHGEALYLHCDLNNEPQSNTEELLKDLSAVVVIRDSSGNEVESIDIGDNTSAYMEGKILLAQFQPFERGEYNAIITVKSGAAALAEKEQVVYAQYFLCGLEQMPAVISGAIAIGAAIVAVICSLCVCPGLLKHGVWRDVATQDA